MSLRKRLTILVTSVLVAMMVGFAWVLVLTTRAELRGQLSDAVFGAAARSAPFPLNPPPPGTQGTRPRRSDANNVTMTGGRRVARLLFDAKGALLNYEPSGFADDPDPIVDLPAIGSAEQVRMVDKLVIRPSENGAIRYLVMTRSVRDGRIRFDAVSMESADRAVRRLTIIALLAGGLAALGASVVTALTIKRTLRPVEEMVVTSERIASGDLAARVPLHAGSLELDRLGGALNGMLATIERAIDARDDKERELRRFIADASHELRTPITVIQGYSDLYRAGAFADRARLDTAMNRIDSQTERMARLVNDLLLLANLEQPEFITRSVTDLSALAAETINEFSMVATDHPTSFRAPSPVYADVDAQRMRQVLDNLLQNVRLHTPSGTAVTVEVKQVGDDAKLFVHNTGPGINPVDLDRLFQRFWRANDASASNSSGLGLAIVESIVTAHGGSIDVQSNDADGTTFTVTIPLKRPTSEG